MKRDSIQRKSHKKARRHHNHHKKQMSFIEIMRLYSSWPVTL